MFLSCHRWLLQGGGREQHTQQAKDFDRTVKLFHRASRGFSPLVQEGLRQLIQTGTHRGEVDWGHTQPGTCRTSGSKELARSISPVYFPPSNPQGRGASWKIRYRILPCWRELLLSYLTLCGYLFLEGGGEGGGGSEWHHVSCVLISMAPNGSLYSLEQTVAPFEVWRDLFHPRGRV